MDCCVGDRWCKKRTIYSLRHFYCTQSLLSGVPIYILAKNMGASLAYTEQTTRTY